LSSKLVILISGSGSNLQSIIDNSEKIGVKIACVISNNPNAFGLERAKNACIPTCIIEHGKFSSRELFDTELAKKIKTFNPKLIILAGFMRILSKDFVQQFPNKILNIHPSLLPKFKGLNTHKRAIEAGETHAGASVHFVTPELDDGEIILQKNVIISPEDNDKSLAKKVLQQEHILYPQAIQKILEQS
jgi:phosphoribosylglycinamide formyltransferase-1